LACTAIAKRLQNDRIDRTAISPHLQIHCAAIT
jgi:hypothetical protein